MPNRYREETLEQQRMLVTGQQNQSISSGDRAEQTILQIHTLVYCSNWAITSCDPDMILNQLICTEEKRTIFQTTSVFT